MTASLDRDLERLTAFLGGIQTDPDQYWAMAEQKLAMDERWRQILRRNLPVWSQLVTLMERLVFSEDPVVVHAVYNVMLRLVLNRHGKGDDVNLPEFLERVLVATMDRCLNDLLLPSVSSLRLLRHSSACEPDLISKLLLVFDHFLLWSDSGQYSQEQILLFLRHLLKLVQAKQRPEAVRRLSDGLLAKMGSCPLSAVADLLVVRESASRPGRKDDAAAEMATQALRAVVAEWHEQRRARGFALSAHTDLTRPRLDSPVRRLLEMALGAVLSACEKEDAAVKQQNEVCFSWLRELLTLLQYPESAAKTITELCSEDDESLIGVIHRILRLRQIADKQQRALPFADLLPKSEELFLLFLVSVDFDSQLIMDWLLGSETRILDFLVDYLRVTRDGPLFPYGDRLPDMVELLSDLLSQLQTSSRLGTLPFPAGPLLHALRAALVRLQASVDHPSAGPSLLQ